MSMRTNKKALGPETLAERVRFAKRCRQFRESQTMTDQDLATILGCTLFTIRNWERGLTTPHHDAMENFLIVEQILKDEL